MPRNLCAPLRAVCLLAIAIVGLPSCAGSDDTPDMSASAALEDSKVRVRVDDIPPGRALLAIVLIDPRGKETPARKRRQMTEEVREEAPEEDSDGILSYVTLDFLFDGGEEVRNVEYLSAEITPKDLLRYVVEYEQSRIEVRYRNARGEKGILTIPAPGP